MVPPNSFFWPSNVKKVYNLNRNMHSEIVFCEQYCDQMTFLIPGTIGKCSSGKKNPILTEFVLIMNSCFIQYNAPLVEYVSLAQEINAFCQT